MSINDLITLVTPPDKPRHGKQHSDMHGSWQACQDTLGITLPNDWKLLGNTYGSGTFRDIAVPQNHLWIYNPLSPNFVGQVQSVCDLQRETEQFHGRVFELHPFFPDDGGYFPFGEDDSHTLWLRTVGPSESWPIIVWGGFGTEVVMEFPLQPIEFLVQLFKGEISIWVDGETGFPDGVRFESDKKT